MKLLIHTCCANCAIYPFERLRTLGINYTGIWFNPNIQPFKEYQLRLDSLKRLSEEWRFPVIYNDPFEGQSPSKSDEIEFYSYFFKFLKEYSSFDMKPFLGSILENPEDFLLFFKKHGFFYGKRCKHCYSLRLEETARTAKNNGFDAFSTTLLVSPYQDFEIIVQTGRELAERYNIEFFFEDFRPGYRDAMKVSRKMGLYRQKYCGCVFSRIEREIQKKNSSIDYRI